MGIKCGRGWGGSRISLSRGSVLSREYFPSSIVCFPTYLFFFTVFLSPPLLIFPMRIDPLRFQAGCCKRQLNLALVFLCLFCVVVHFFWLVIVCFWCVRFSFFHTKPGDWLGEASPKWPILCWMRRKTTTQSVVRFCWWRFVACFRCRCDAASGTSRLVDNRFNVS